MPQRLRVRRHRRLRQDQQDQQPENTKNIAAASIPGSQPEASGGSAQQIKTGNLAVPRFVTFAFAVAAFYRAAGGTHRVRGVM
jgi:hypothetical protein